MEREILALRDELLEKERDLEMAADFGQSLLLEKEALENEIATLKSTSQECAKCFIKDKRIKEQESSHSDLVFEYENVRTSLLSEEAHKKALAVANKELQQSLAKQKCEFDVSERERSKLKSELEALHAKNLVIQQDLEYLKVQQVSNKRVTVQEDRVKELEKEILYKTEENISMKATLVERNEECEIMKARFDEMEQMLETYQSYKETCEELENKVDELEHSIDVAQETNNKLKARIAILQPVDDIVSTPDTGCKTLLTELEDQRVELQSQNVELIEKHAGLEISHHKALHQQQRMKNHIARLSQLSSAEESQEKMIKLEQALAQAESEKSELEERLDKLQRQGHFVLPPDFDEDSEFTSDDKSRILEYQVQSLMDEIESLRKSNKMIRLVKTAETSKLHEALTSLNEKGIELDRIKRENSRLRFEIDDLLLKFDANEQTINHSKENKIPVDENIAMKSLNKPVQQVPKPDGAIVVPAHIPLKKKETNIPPEKINAKISTFPIPEKPKGEVKTVKVNRANTQECNQQ